MTSLNPLIVYDTAAEVAKEAFASGKTVRQLCQEKNRAGTLTKKNGEPVKEAELKAVPDPRSMTGPERG